MRGMTLTKNEHKLVGLDKNRETIYQWDYIGFCMFWKPGQKNKKYKKHPGEK